MNAKSRIVFAAIVSPAAALALSMQAAAGEPPPVEQKRPAIVLEVDRGALRIDATQQRLAVAESIRAALAEADKAARGVELANAGPRNGG